MGVIQLSDELRRVIERQVAEGRAADPATFPEEAVRRLVDDGRAEEDQLRQTSEDGSADMAAGRVVTVTGEADQRSLHSRLMTRLQTRLSGAG